jgi:polar amino acid transport system permease protein
MLVLIFFIALVLVPGIINGINALGAALSNIGIGSIGSFFSAVAIRDIPMALRAVIALSITYGAFLAEVFRAGIQSISRGQMEAARSQGMSYGQAMRYVILPQAIRNVLPALGNDFISMLKDSSLVSVLAVRDITQVAKLYAGHSFRFQQAYISLAILYLVMTVSLSLLVKVIERRYGHDGR